MNMNRENILKLLADKLTVWNSAEIEKVLPPDSIWCAISTVGKTTVFKPDAQEITEVDWQIACKTDPVNNPSHYHGIDGVEVIELIASAMTHDEWRGFCLGNTMKYRMRAGKKGTLQQDIDKANKYEELFEQFKGLNRNDRF